MPLYGGLTLEEQMQCFIPAQKGSRKCIVATNVAEASLTIDGIVYVIDSGFFKVRSYSHITSMESLITIPISQASAQQRAGRCGRTKAGKAYRLYTESSFKSLLKNTIPEMQR
jgi:ATP-dependent RNA helicase DDX35